MFGSDTCLIEKKGLSASLDTHKQGSRKDPCLGGSREGVRKHRCCERVSKAGTASAGA